MTADAEDADTEPYRPADEGLFDTSGPGIVAPRHEVPQWLVEEVIEAIESPRRFTREAVEQEVWGHQVPGRDDETRDVSERWLPALDLPGFGAQYTEDDGRSDFACGEEFPLFCTCCGDIVHTGRTCGRSVCSRCAPAWARDRAVNICARLDATRRVRQQRRDKHQRFHHFVASPDADWWLEAEDVLDRTFKVIRDILNAMDLNGYVFYHPWTGDTQDEDEDDRGKWQARLFNDRTWQDVRKELTSGNPHFHIVAVGHAVPGKNLTTEVYNRTGWVLNRITKSEDSNVSIGNDYDLARAVTYCISHTGIDTTGEQNRAQYRYYGSTLNDVDVYDDKKERIEKIVRKVVPKTLGLPMREQLCTQERVKREDEQGGGPAAGSFIYGAGTPQEASMSASTGGSTAAAESATESEEFAPGTNGLETTEGAGDVSLERDEADSEPEPCEGIMRPISEAPTYLEDEEWVKVAEHAGSLQTTWERWKEDNVDPGET